MSVETLQAIINALQGSSLLPVFLLSYLLKVYVVNGNINRYFERKDKENALLERIDASLVSIIDRQEKQVQIFLERMGKGKGGPGVTVNPIHLLVLRTLTLTLTAFGRLIRVILRVLVIVLKLFSTLSVIGQKRLQE